MNSDDTWEYFGKNDPYFGVLSSPTFRSDELNPAVLEEFFASGRRYTDLLFSIIREKFDPQFRPERALDFGCGVGRLSLALARECDEVVGVDVSEPMLEHARTNAEQAGAHNVSFVKGDDTLSHVSGTFDLLNSLIVFQHIPTDRGEALLRRMLGMLRDGGVGALQFTYGYSSGTPLARELLDGIYKHVPYAWNVRNLVKGEPFDYPMMQMNRYDLNSLFRILQEGGCHVVHPRFTQTQSFGRSFYGVILFFQKKRTATTEHA